MPVIARRVSELIGRTPLFELAVSPITGTRLFLKLETMNPTGTAKIRMARAMVLDAERRGLLRPGGHIVESTSGNTGLGLAVVARERGYRFTAVVDNHACKAKLNAMRAMGTVLEFVSDDGDDGLSTSAREERAAELAAQLGAYFPAQHANPANGVGYVALAGELVADLGHVDVLVAAVGTGGSLFGTARGLRERGCDPRLIGVEPEGSIAFGGPGHDYWQSGTGTPIGAEPGVHVDQDLHLIEERDRVKVSDVNAFATTRALASELGLLIGGSSGSSVYAALTRIDEFPCHSTVLVIINDDGEKYLDTVFDDEWMADRDLLDVEREAEIARLLAAHRPAARPDPRERAALRHLHYALPDDYAVENGLTGRPLREYADAKVPEATLIHQLELVDMPAHEIGELLAAGDDGLVCLALDKYRQRLEDQAAMLAQLIAKMRGGTPEPPATHTILMPDATPATDSALAATRGAAPAHTPGAVTGSVGGSTPAGTPGSAPGATADAAASTDGAAAK
ncbi:pyridoxal-phosphate dependent enzyme [Nocardia tengchongensis]|uniref:Pyridoxal-phosphate dependent enzyme n=1 Tax=Nocardia tengchongensis TaxID=2055889 RepID=A0ABX8CU23_9NOCA|nr:pyridoxal-phosphate dependent enzyme [Nocardia tengchongensis]